MLHAGFPIHPSSAPPFFELTAMCRLLEAFKVVYLFLKGKRLEIQLRMGSIKSKREFSKTQAGLRARR
jgi:hypothetical protein